MEHRDAFDVEQLHAFIDAALTDTGPTQRPKEAGPASPASGREEGRASTADSSPLLPLTLAPPISSSAS